MQKVTIIELNGNAFHVDEPGFEQLRAYLDRAAAKLAADPDRVEIMADLEQAIAEKLRKFLHPHKTVVSAAEVAQVLTEMGPVESDAGAAGATPGASGPAEPRAAAADAGAAKRLYQIREGALVSGVCNGLAAYFGVDVTLVRVIFVALTVFTFGGWILAYIAMMFVIPYAQTSEEHAAAHGLPFTAQKLVEQAKQQHARFTQKEWRRHWRRQRRDWREAQRRWRHGFAHRPEEWGPPQPADYAGQVVGGILLPLFGLANAVLTAAFIFALVSLVITGTILGWHPPLDVPRWTAILSLALLYGLAVWPLHAVQRAAYHALYGTHHRWFAASAGTFSLLWAIVVFYLAYHYVPGVREFVLSIPAAWSELLQHLQHGAPPAPPAPNA